MYAESRVVGTVLASDSVKNVYVAIHFPFSSE